jgi:hypothetical protein
MFSRLLTLLIAHRIFFVARNIFCCQKMCTYISREGQNGHSGDKWGNSHISDITEVSNFWVVLKVHFVKKICAKCSPSVESVSRGRCLRRAILMLSIYLLLNFRNLRRAISKLSSLGAHIMLTWLRFLKHTHFISKNAHGISSVRTAKLAVWYVLKNAFEIWTQKQYYIKTIGPMYRAGLWTNEPVARLG